MQAVAIRSLSVAMFALCAITASLAQQILYLDRDYQPASESSYAFKRVIQQESMHHQEHLRDKNGNVRDRPSIVYVCSVRDYYASGEPALVGESTSSRKGCNLDCALEDGTLTYCTPSFQGKVIYYYPSGRIRKTEFYQDRVRQGDVITYAEDGRILTKQHYEGGLLIDDKKYAVAADDPLVGKWKSVKHDCLERSSRYKTCVFLWTFSSNGILYSRFVSEVLYGTWEEQTNWKYTSTGPATGVLEEFQGGMLCQREDIRWMSKNEFEETITFSPDPDSIGQRTRFVRDRKLRE